MKGFELHDAETQENLGAVVITHRADILDKTANDEETLEEAWEEFNKLEETEGDHTSVDEFVVWFNEGYVTQIERLYLDVIQH